MEKGKIKVNENFEIQLPKKIVDCLGIDVDESIIAECIEKRTAYLSKKN